MLNQLRLGTRFTIILGVVLIGGIIVSWITLSRVLERRAQDEVTTRGVVLIETMNSVRRYTSTHVNPLLVDQLENSDEFISETVPAFSAREVFEGFRSDPEYEKFLYKEATLNPTNPRDQADNFETEIVNEFRNDPNLKEQTGYRDLGTEEVFYIARPLAISAESCLRCHSEPDAAPASLVNTYGTNGGFGWELNEVVAAQMIYVPAKDVFDTARLSLTYVLIIFVIVFTVVILLINFLLRLNVIRPVELIAAVAGKITAGDVTQEDLRDQNLDAIATRGDEPGQLARVFQKMADEVMKRETQLKDQVAKLRIEIDESRKTRDVEQIIESDYFQDLKKRAQELRDKTEADSEKKKGDKTD
ncbi:MAG TPA: DUF3365 domain-containing protein [Aggregatilineales bacterium]|nr:DUF3365 domain-containing protein [Aggregatilineales bacterium]